MSGLNIIRAGLGLDSRSELAKPAREEGASLLGSQSRSSSPIGGTLRSRVQDPASPRQGATIIGGAIERLWGMGTTLDSGVRRLPQSLNPWRSGRHSVGLLPGQHQDIELLERDPLPHASHSRERDKSSGYAQLEEKLDKEVDEVLANSFNWKKAGIETSKSLARGATAAGALYGAYSLVDTMIQAKAPLEQQGTARGFVAMGMLTPVYQESKELVNGLRSAVTTNARLSYAEALEKTHHRRQTESTEYLKTLPSDIQNVCKKIDLFLMQALAAAKKGDKVNYSLIRGMMHWRKDFMINRPMKTKEVDAIKSDDGRADLIGRLNTELRRYPPALHDKLCGFTLGIAARSVEHELPPHFKAEDDFDLLELSESDDWHRWKEVPLVPKQMMMLAGAPGTGKTHYAEKVLPKLLHLPVPSLIMPDKQAGGVASLMAKDWSALEQDEFVTADTDAMGKIGLLLNRAGCLNPVLLLDEADLDDMDGIKRLTDPSRDKLEAVALETVLNFAKVTILMGVNALKRAANTPADGGPGELEPALADRMEMALFEGTDPETKREAAITAYHGWAGLYCLPIKGGEGAQLDAAQQNRLQGLFKGCLDYLVNAHHVDAKIPGARMQVPVASVVNYIAYRLMQEKYHGAPAVTSQNIEEYLRQFYALRMNKPTAAVNEASQTQAESSHMAQQRTAANRVQPEDADFLIGDDSDSEVENSYT